MSDTQPKLFCCSTKMSELSYLTSEDKFCKVGGATYLIRVGLAGKTEQSCPAVVHVS